MDMILAAFVGFLAGGICGIAVMAVVVSKVVSCNEDNEEL